MIGPQRPDRTDETAKKAEIKIWLTTAMLGRRLLDVLSGNALATTTKDPSFLE